MNIKELREQRAKVYEEIKKLGDLVVAEGRKLVDDEQKNWDQWNADYDGLSGQLAMAERLKSLESEQKAVKPLVEPRSFEPDNRPVDTIPEPTPVQITEEHRCQALTAWFRCNSSRRSALTEQQEQSCRLLKFDPRVSELSIRLHASKRFDRMQHEGWGGGYGRSFSGAEQRALSAVTGTTGGFLVPETLVNQLELNLLAFGGMMQASQIVRTGTGEPMTWPTADDTSNSGRQLGESVAATTTDPTFGGVTWSAYKFSSDEVLVPTELLEDSVIDIASVIGEMLGVRLGRILNSKFTTGNGAGTPKGITIAAAAGQTTASATAIAWDEITDLIYDVDPAYRPGSAFMFHDNIGLALRKLLDGNGRPLWADGPNSTPPPTLQGFPYFINQDMASSIATTNITMLFGQLSAYKIRQVNEVRMYRLTERHRENDQDAFLAFIRADGNLLTSGTDRVVKMTQV